MALTRWGRHRQGDLRVVVANYTEGTSAVRVGAKAYISPVYPGALPDNVFLVVRSRGGRWIEKWERIKRLDNFRLKTIPPGHPLHDSNWLHDCGEEFVAGLRQCRSEVMSRRVDPEVPGVDLG
jgi:hypothetical protein